MKKLITDSIIGWKSIFQAIKEFRQDELRKPILYFVWGRYAWLDLIGVFVATGILIIFIKMIVSKTFTMDQLSYNWSGLFFKCFASILDITILGGFYIGWRIRNFLHSEFYLSYIKMIPKFSERLYPLIFFPILILPLLLFLFNNSIRIYSWFTNEDLREVVSLWGLIFNFQTHSPFFIDNLLEIIIGIPSPIFFLGMMYSKMLLIVLVVTHAQSGIKAVLGTLLIVFALIVYEKIGWLPSEKAKYYPEIIGAFIKYLNSLLSQR